MSPVFGSDDPGPDPVEAKRQELRDINRALEENGARRDQLRDRLVDLDAQVADARVRAQRTVLTDGDQAQGGTAVETEADRLQAERDELAGERQELLDRRDAVQGELAELVRERIRDTLRPRVREARERRVAALEALAEAVAPAYRDLLSVRFEEREAFDELRAALGSADAPSVAERELKRNVEAPLRDASPAARLGWYVARALGWSRRRKSGTEAFWTERDIPILEGSARHHRPLGALEQILANMSDGNLPS